MLAVWHQDGVPEAIAMLIEAGIKVWVLTGDKVETAITIALTAHLFDETMSLVEVRERDFEGREDNEAQAQVRGGGAGRGMGECVWGGGLWWVT